MLSGLLGKKGDHPPAGGPGRVESGIPRLDYILKGGFIRGGTYSLMGPPGSGKTILGNQFCFNHVSQTDGRCVTLLVESYDKMLHHMASLKFFNPDYIPDRVFYVSRYTELRSQLYRLVSIMKMRESRYDTSIREFQITDDGIRVAASFESAEAILTGHARVADGPKGGGS